MIAPSDFQLLAQRGLQPITVALQETFNGENARPTYLFRNFLGKRYSIDGTYQSLGVDNGLIVADVIALDSPLPIKTRPSIKSAKGEIPKIGTERSLNESELKQVRLLQRAGGDESTIARSIFADVRHVYGGVLEQLEYQFLEGLSNGFFVRDTDNVGIGIRVDYNYQPENLFNASVIWGQAGYTPITDMSAVLDKASNDGNDISVILLDRATMNQILTSSEAKLLFANSIGLATEGAVPTVDQLNSAMSSRYGVTFMVINRSVTVQVNGVKKTIKPWAVGQLVFLTQMQVGDLVWSDVEEMSQPVGGVVYSRAEEFVLISQYKSIRPSLKHWTAAQAVALPVINGFNIYKLDSTALSA